MAQFNVDGHLRGGERLDWLALPEKGETPDDVVIQVRQGASESDLNAPTAAVAEQRKR